VAEVEIGWWPLDRAPELQAFVDAEFRTGHVLARDGELLQWQHPLDAERLSVAGATVDDELVGILGAIRFEASVRGDRVPGVWLTTWATAPAWRSQQVGLRLLEFVAASAPVAGTVGGNDTTIRILAALRYDVCRSMPRWVLPLDAVALARLGVRTTAAEPARADADVDVARSLSPALADAWDETWATRVAPSVVATWHDASYVRRRYLEHPRFRYDTRWAVEDGVPTALLVTRLERVADVDASVLRVLEAIGDRRAVAALATQAARDAAAAGAAFADFYCTSERFAAPLVEAGFAPDETFPNRFQPFEPRPRPLSIALRLADETTTRGVLAGGDAYFTKSDCDQDRPN
jgi:GNAT superfamily N-acetyltransferase